MDINISLTPELAELVNQKVTSGMYHSASDVVREGLRLLKEQDEVADQRLEKLRQQLQIGIDSLDRGDSRTFYSGEELAAHIEAEGRGMLNRR